MAKDKQVRFVRIRGRIVPIKVKPGSGTRGGRLKSSKLVKQKVGSGVASAGTIFASIGLIEHQLGRELLDPTISKVASGGKFIRDSFLNSMSIAAKKRGNDLGAMRIKRRVSSPFMPGIKQFRNTRFIKMTSGKKIAVGLGLLVGGAVLSNVGNKQRARNTRLLNKGRKK